GAVALSDDGDAVKDAGLLRRAMSYARQVGLPVIEHSEDATLSNGGAMHEGMWSVVLGLRGIPSVSEEAIVARDIVLAEDTGARLHVAHVSTAGSVALIREAKRRRVGVTAEVTPHHLLLTDEAVGGYNTDTKMNPPLRGQADRAALVEGLLDGTIDAIATDHARGDQVQRTSRGGACVERGRLKVLRKPSSVIASPGGAKQSPAQRRSLRCARDDGSPYANHGSPYANHESRITNHQRRSRP